MQGVNRETADGGQLIADLSLVVAVNADALEIRVPLHEQAARAIAGEREREVRLRRGREAINVEAIRRPRGTGRNRVSDGNCEENTGNQRRSG
jgi:hypothetical protein